MFLRAYFADIYLWRTRDRRVVETNEHSFPFTYNFIRRLSGLQLRFPYTNLLTTTRGTGHVTMRDSAV